MKCTLQGPPYKFALRVLSEKYLKRRIQMGEHDSVQVSWWHILYGNPVCQNVYLVSYNALQFRLVAQPKNSLPAVLEVLHQ